MNHHVLATLLISLSSICMVQAANFDFVNGVGVDGLGVGGTMTVEGVTLTTKDVRGWNGTDFTLASAGGGHEANVGGSTGTELGVNSNSTPPNAPNDPKNFDPGEAWMLTFSTGVNLNAIDVKSFDSASDQMTISAPGILPVVISENGVNPLGDVFIAAGTILTIENSSPVSSANESHDFRIGRLIVVPAEDLEPKSLGLISS